MKDWGVVKKFNSPWCSTIMLIRNNEDLRFCVNYQRLNKVTKKDCLLPPRIDDTLDKLTGAKQLPIMDLTAATCKMPCALATWTKQDSQLFTAIHSGLCNALEMLKQLMKFILQGLSYEACLVSWVM
jgi:hypothetical protein